MTRLIDVIDFCEREIPQTARRLRDVGCRASAKEGAEQLHVQGARHEADNEQGCDGNEDVEEYKEETIGTKENPLTVNDAIALINSYADGASSPNPAIVKGKISKIDGYNANYKSITYWISDDGGTKTQLQVYSGKGLNGADFASKEDLSVGKKVVIKGKLKKYNTTYEFDKTSSIISIE